MTYLGSFCHIAMKLVEGGETIAAQAPPGSTFEAGQTVCVTWNSEDEIQCMRLRNLFLAPTAILMAITMLAPLAIIVVYSLLTRGAYGGVELPWTIENFTRLWDPVYGIIFLRSFWIAAVATALCLVLGFPLAMFIARSGSRKNLYLSLVILPFWTSFLIRTYAWMFLLRDTGIVNSVLQALRHYPRAASAAV